MTKKETTKPKKKAHPSTNGTVRAAKSKLAKKPVSKKSVAKKRAFAKSTARPAKKRSAFPGRRELPPEKAAARGAAAAAAAIKKKDWQGALTGIAAAVQFDPFHRDWVALLDRALELGGKSVEPFLKKVGNEPFVGFCGLKAYAAYRRGDYTTAFTELDNVTGNFPHTQFIEAWGLDWMTEKAIKAAGRDLSMRVLEAMVSNRYPEPGEVSDWGREQLNRAIAALECIESVTGASDVGIVFKGRMLSKAGRLGDAIAMAEREAEENPTFHTATAAAMAHKRNCDIDAAVHWFRRASDFDRKNETCLLDIGDVRVDQEKWQDALDAYEEALERVPNHDWAHPSAVYCRYRLTNDPKHLEELRYMANAGPDECGMASIVKQLMGGYNFEDRRLRAEALMKLIEPNFVSVHRLHEHDEEDEE